MLGRDVMKEICESRSKSQSPTGDFLLGSFLKAAGFKEEHYIVSIPHGGFFVGKTSRVSGSEQVLPF